jgi:hypothetical protein
MLCTDTDTTFLFDVKSMLFLYDSVTYCPNLIIDLRPRYSIESSLRMRRQRQNALKRKRLFLKMLHHQVLPRKKQPM